MSGTDASKGLSPAWTALRALTPARIALGRCGAGLPTSSLLAFQADHARARDAVWAALDVAALRAALAPRASLTVASQATSRGAYLNNPDLGRSVRREDRDQLTGGPFDLAIVVGDGLSALAVNAYAPAVIHRLLAGLGDRWTVAPIVIVRQARVAVADEIGERLGAAVSVILLGERPGLSAADSLGLYLTWGPRPGRRDSERNCISNVRAGGQSCEEAADRLAWLIAGAWRLGATGVGLKDTFDDRPQLPATSPHDERPGDTP